VIEAPDRGGERAVALAPDRGAVAAAAAAAVAESRDDYCLVEEHVGGRVVSVTGFVRAGSFAPLTLTDRESAPPPAFGVSLAHLWPAALAPDEADAISGLTADAAAALGIEDGPVIAQVLLAPSGPLLAKLSARTGGGHDSELCRTALGVDLDDLAVAAALGETVAAEALRSRALAGGACVRFLVAPGGELTEVHGLAAACNVPGVVAVRSYRRPGHLFAPLRRASDRAGAVLAAGATREEAATAAAEAASRMRFAVVERAEAVA
jgi:biotin carboxylase